MAPPYVDPERMATVSRTGVIDSADWVVPYSWVTIWRRQHQVVEGVAAYSAQPQESLVTLGGQRSHIGLVQVETNLLQVFGVKLLLGPTFPLSAASCHNCLVLSYQAWRHDFAGDPNILQKKATINGQDAIVIGVLPERFWFPTDDVGVLRLGDETPFPAEQAGRRGGPPAARSDRAAGRMESGPQHFEWHRRTVLGFRDPGMAPPGESPATVDVLWTCLVHQLAGDDHAPMVGTDELASAAPRRGCRVPMVDLLRQQDGPASFDAARRGGGVHA